MFSLALRRLVLLLLLCISFAPCAWASSRIIESPGANIRRAQLVVIADTAPDTANRETMVTIKEVLKGDKKWVGQTLRFPRVMIFYVMPDVATDCVLFFDPAPPNSKDPFMVLEAFTKPAEIEATKALIPIYQLPAERAQLLALRDLWAGDDKILRAQFIEDLGHMHEANNFALLLDFFAQTDADSQYQLLDLLGRIGDTRALPQLMATMENPEASDKLRYSASVQLQRYFSDAPGVTAAFRRVFPTATGNLQVLAARYLNQREPDAKYQESLPSPTLWMRANALLKQGDTKGAREVWWQVLATPDLNSYSLYSTARELLASATAQDKARLRTAILPQLRHDVFEGNYLEALNAAELLRALGQSQDLDLLLNLLNKSDWIYNKARRVAAMALCEMGALAQQKAVAQLLESLQPLIHDNTTSYVPHLAVFALAWLGSDDDWQQAKTVLRDEWKYSWQFLDDLHRAAHAADEGAALAKLLDSGKAMVPDADEWILFRLQELADVSAVPALAKFLREHPRQESATVVEILTRIGRENAENQAIVVEAVQPLLNLLAPNDAGPYAVQIITRLQGARARPLLRSLVSENSDLWVKVEAISALGSVGTADDLDLLLPLANFWTAPRTSQSQAFDAVRSIRDRLALGFTEVAPQAKT